MTVIVSGAGGELGQLTAAALLRRVSPDSLVLLSRDPDKLETFRERGATVRHADFDRPETLPEAFAGATCMLLISTNALGRRVEQHRTAIRAAAAAGIGHVVYTSLPNPADSNPALVAEEHRLTEEALFASGLSWTMLRNALYAEHRIPEGSAAIKAGAFRHNLGQGQTAYVSRLDCAAAAAAVMAAPSQHEGEVYDITGPELVGAAQLAELYSRFARTELPVVQIGDTELEAVMVADGLPDYVARLLVSFGAATREGQLDQLSSAVKDLTGLPPRTLRSVVEPSLAFVGAML